MSIEDDLRASKAEVDPSHKQHLRESLLTEMKERTMKTQQKRPKFVWTLALVPVMAVLVLVSLTMWQPKTDNVIVRQLTTQEVLAKAISYNEVRSLGTETLPRYQKVFFENRTPTVGSTCYVETYYLEEYYLPGHQMVRYRVSLDGVVVSKLTGSSEGMPDNFTYTNGKEDAVALTTRTESCPDLARRADEANARLETTPRTPSQQADFIAQLEAENGLSSINTSDQIRAFEQLKKVATLSVSYDMSTPYSQDKLITLYGGTRTVIGGDSKYYFDANDGSYVGYEDSFEKWIIVEEGQKSLPSE